MKLPNCFIVGAPRCGTTALASYLAEHPEVFFSLPKEPFFWSDDCDRLRQEVGIQTLDQYLSLFSAATASHRVLAEGSTTYLQSPGAVERILELNPDARFIAMIRNPVDTVQSRHQQLLFCYDEEVEDFEAAWMLQAARKEGKSIPERSRTPQFLQYGDYARYSSPLERFFAQVPASQRRVIVFDDFIRDPLSCHRETLSFLGLGDDGRRDFPKIHDRMKYRFGGFHHFIRFPPKAIASPLTALRRTLHRQFPGVLLALRRVLRVKEQRSNLRPEFLSNLRSYFREDVDHLSRLMNRDLTHWTSE